MKEQDTSSPTIHLQQQQLLLRMEYEFEKEEFRRQTENMGVARKVKRGLCWYPASSGRSYYNSLNQLVIEVTHTEDTDIEHCFEFGRPVCFFRQSADGKITYMNFTATVSYADEGRMVVVMPGTGAVMEVQAADNLGVQLYFDETSYRTMFEALEDTLRAKGNRLAELRDTLLDTSKAKFRELYPVRFPWLNATQESAVNKVLCTRDVAIVHGPPGTGKTTTLVEAIYETLHREPQVMVCAQSNTAVDWISEKLVDRGVNVLRIGNPTRVNDKMLSFTYERRFESHSLYTELWSIRQELRQLQGKTRRGSYDEREGVRSRISRLRDRATALELQINAELFDSAHVIASTLVGSNHRLLSGHRFGTLFIDEAAQALEAACWIAIRKADRVILAGDHCQLPPTVKCPEAARGGLERTLMETVAAAKPTAVSLLKMQYRMHEDIMRFSSEWFYNGELKAAPEVRHRGILDWDTPICWIDTSEMNFKEEFVGETFGRINKEEANLLLQELEAYILRIGGKRILEEQIDFGLISPYKAQVQHLRNKIKTSAALRPYRSLLTVNTVDGFQGQERDVIFISLVRANEDGQIGFLHDLRRMNVAITRARMKLVILGEADTLNRHAFYKKLMEYIKEQGGVKRAERLEENKADSNGENPME
ncbi:AAA domain-containing protein [Bacteroides helcogenes]|uniref:Helicase n=1 Tax=Bacteroides helcogenes (strain ATCC 35417 / DSM 20613 / JCM 6297 / CCUG 15421 / P 36-108) TaxID=693979 RepID=E6ST35_BACT6|nr:AAA domain-containing protein [Bacteroides helcogenes]ADV45239.1 putative helicase [Bacteroides helcogenes P 36-108]MDY5238800.1 AAA domain-containing protein [Bacteroides helcogenes]